MPTTSRFPSKVTRSLHSVSGLQMINLVIKTISFHKFYLKVDEQVYLININLVPLNPSPVTFSEELVVCRCEALANLPPEYHDYAKSVFNEVEPTQALPSRRSHIDYRIDLVDGSSSIFGSIYNLSKTKLKVLKEYIEISIAKGII